MLWPGIDINIVINPFAVSQFFSNFIPVRIEKWKSKRRACGPSWENIPLFLKEEGTPIDTKCHLSSVM